MPLSEITLRARYVFPVDAAPIACGIVRIAGDRIAAIGKSQHHCDIDLGNAAILPGLVNAHTHLELSALRSQEFAASSFVNWLNGVIRARGAQAPSQISHAIGRGIDASLSAGTTLLGDISTSGRSWKELTRSPLRAVVFAELLGLKAERALQTTEAARQFLEWATAVPGAVNRQSLDAPQPDAGTRFHLDDESIVDPLPVPATNVSSRRLMPSLSPHAPYSTHRSLYDLAARWGRHAGVPVCTHLAETTDELRLLRQRDGPLHEFLRSIAAWTDTWQAAGTSPLNYIDGAVTGQAHWIIAHANYLTADEIARLGAHSHGSGGSIAVVYCPRTHAYFGHRNHPYREMLAAGLVVCLGTDSLASTSTLSILDEMRYLRRRDAALDPAKILEMGTLAGARALGREHDCGSLTPGKFADIAVVRLPERQANDPYDLLFKSSEPVIRTMIGGRFVFQRR
jgi:cytosine/adenosine deaminase-related metal-dependent hydrolase